MKLSHTFRSHVYVYAGTECTCIRDLICQSRILFLLLFPVMVVVLAVVVAMIAAMMLVVCASHSIA